MAESKSSSRVFLLSSVVLGVLAMVAAFVYLENSAGKERGPKATILVAKHDLREGTAIDPAKDLDEMEVPARMTGLKAGALDPQFSASYKGQRINRSILAGNPVMLADLTAMGSLELRGDSRALSVTVKGAHGLSGLVVPGDLVKLMVTRPAAPPRLTTMPAESIEAPVAAPQRWETVLVAPNAFRVLAVNQRLSRSRPQVTAADQYSAAAESRGEQTVTLEVTEAQARLILENTGAGQLPVTLLLCPPGTTTAPAGG